MKTVILALLLTAGAFGQSVFMEPSVKYVEKVDNGHIVSIDGVSYLAITADKAREFLKYRLVSQELARQIEVQKKLFSDYRATSESLLASEKEKAQLELDKSKAESEFFRKQYEEEKALREVFEKNVRKCGSPWLFGYRLCKF